MAATDTMRPSLRALLPPALWGAAALLAVGAVAVAINSETGRRQIAAGAAALAPSQPAPPRPSGPTVAELLARAQETELEASRLADNVRVLTTDRDRLMARISSLERTIEDITGSLASERARARARDAALAALSAGPRSPPPAPSPAPPATVAATAPSAPQPAAPSEVPAAAALASGPPKPAEALPAPPPAKTPDPPPPAATPARTVAAARPASEPDRPVPDPSWLTHFEPLNLPLPPPPLAIPLQRPAAPPAPGRAEFGIDVGGATDIDALRELWVSLTARYATLERLRPSVVLYDTKSGPPEMRLVLGPLPNVASASKLCASLAVAGINCQTALYDGQKLAWR